MINTTLNSSTVQPTNNPTTTFNTTNQTTSVKPYYTKPLTSDKNFKFDLSNQNDVANLAVDIMSYRREYTSDGIAKFCEDYLEPKINTIVKDLTDRGYTIACQVVGTDLGYRNYCVDVSLDDRTSDVLYVAHYDTVDKDVGYSKYGKVANASTVTPTTPQHIKKAVSVKDGIAYLDLVKPENKDVGCLGADDGAGLAVMLNLMSRGILGGYCFVTGEEKGGIGANEITQHAQPFLKQYKFAIEIDRRGEDEIIYSQGIGDCASVTFTQWLCDELNMGQKPSNLGSYTDVADFAYFIPECVNIASGYSSAHTTNETVSLVYLRKLADRLAKVDWEKAPIERTEGDYGEAYYDYGYYDYGYGSYGTTNKKKSYGYKAPSKNNANITYDDVVSSMALDLLHKLIMVDQSFLAFLIENTPLTTDQDVEDVIEMYYGVTADEFYTRFDF